MAGEWKQTRLGDHITLKGGLSYKGEFVDKGDALLIGMGSVSHTERFLRKGGRQYGGDFSETHLVRPGDLVIATRQQSDNLPILGFPAMIPEDLRGRNVIAATNLYKVTNHSEVSNRFLYWLMRGPAYRERILGCAKGTTVRMLTKDAIEDFDFLCPPEEERDAIAEVLDTLDDKIELNRRMNETLEAIARTIFKSWFVDFDPVRAKASGEPPESICRRLGLTPDLLALFPDRLVDSELGEIPEGWVVGRISDVTGFLSGYAFKSKDWIESGVPVVKIGSVKPGIVDLSATSFVSDEVADQAKRFRLASGDLLIGMTGYVGEVGLVPPTDTPPMLNQRVGKFILETPGTSALAFLYCVTRRPEFKEQVATKSHGTAQANVSADGVLSIPIVVPMKMLRCAFNKICHPLLDRILENHAEACTLSTLRDTLLPKLLSGELRVNDAEILNEGVHA